MRTSTCHECSVKSPRSEHAECGQDRRAQHNRTVHRSGLQMVIHRPGGIDRAKHGDAKDGEEDQKPNDGTEYVHE
jgi:hypothetical protein